jgi:hypothetical protein
VRFHSSVVFVQRSASKISKNTYDARTERILDSDSLRLSDNPDEPSSWISHLFSILSPRLAHYSELDRKGAINLSIFRFALFIASREA